MKRKPLPIDRDKLHAAVRKVGNEHVFYMLDEAKMLAIARRTGTSEQRKALAGIKGE